MKFSSRRARLWAIVGLALALLGAPTLMGAPWFQQTIAWIAGSSEVVAIFVGQSCIWVLVGAVLSVAAFGEGAPLSSVGLTRPRARAIGWGVGIGLGVYGVLMALALGAIKSGLIDEAAFNDSAARVMLSTPLWLRVYICVTAGVAEEILYRGYAIERLAWFVKKPWLAAVISVLAFSLAHAPFWGWERIGAPLIAGAFFSALYIWRGNLTVCIVAHIVIDLISLVVLPAFAGE